MAKLPALSGKRLLSVLLRHGFIVLRQRGSHMRVASSDGSLKTVVPAHANRDLPRGTLENIMEDLNINANELHKWL